MCPNRIKKRFFQAPEGMHDILPADQAYWQKAEQIIRRLAESYGFERLDTPILENASLFTKAVGLADDVIEKEMYLLKTKGGEKLALRSELTPSILRAYLERNLSNWPHPVKLYTIGPVFRYQKIQDEHRYQSVQANFEIIGEKEAVVDAQLIQILFSIIRKELGLKNVTVQINSVGCPKCRSAYRRSLVSFYRKRKNELCPECQKRLTQNPWSLLNCHEEHCEEIKEEAPQIIDYLCDECHNHFKDVLEYLDALEIPYILNPYLVRGLNYYTKTVFEIWPEEEERKWVSLGGGGRYDSLIKILGGAEKPAVGFSLDINRIVDLFKERNIKVSPKKGPLIFLIQLGELGKKKSLVLFEELRKSGLKVAASFSENTIKTQLKTASKHEAPFSLFIGQKEALDNTVILKDMESGSQEVIPLNKVIRELKKKLKKK